MTLIEREHEMDRLETALKDGSAGRGSTVLIEGPPGIGKSTLLDHARRIADDLGVTATSASAAEFESGLGFTVIRSLLAGPLSELSTEERTSVFEGAAHLALGPLGLRDPSEAALEPGAAVHGLYWLCANLADRKPLLLAIDDLHWADEPSLLFLGYLARRASEHPLVICATTRPIEREPSERYLAALAEASSGVVTPHALRAEGVAHVVGRTFKAPPAPEFCEACARVTGGNPFLLMEMLTAKSADGVEPTAEEADRIGEFGSATLSRTLLSRVARLGPDARRVAGVAAILGQDAELRRVAALCDLDEGIVVDAVEGLRREGILARDGVLEFAHPLIRHAVYTDIGEPARGLGHLHAARLLDADGEHSRVAPHLLLAERKADPWVVERLRTEAAAALDSGAPTTAAELLERALAEPADPGDRPALGLDLGRAHLRGGDAHSATDALRKALDLADEPMSRAEIAIELGRALRFAGHIPEAIALFDEAVKNLPAGHHDLEMSIEFEIAVSWHVAQPEPQWIERLADAAQCADGSTLPDRAVRAMYAIVAAFTGATEAAEVARLAQSSITPDGATDPPLILQGTATALALSGSLSEALRVLDHALDICRRTGDVAQFGLVSFTRTWVANHAGRVLEGQADAQTVLDTPLISPVFGNYAVAHLMVALIERDATDEANRVLNEYGLAESSGELENVTDAVILWARGRLHLTSGRLRDAAEDLDRCQRILQRAGFTGPAFGEFREHSALTYLALGERETARGIALEYVQLSRGYGAPRGLGVALRTLGLVEGGAHGLELLAESVEVLAESEAALDHAKSLVEYGAALRRAGKALPATDLLRQGLDLASRCGALAVANRARDELVAAGARPRRERLTGPESLTASELRVARMAAGGRSNPEIAQALFVTRHTVEVHLTHAYRKLGIRSRDALAAALAAGPDYAEDRPTLAD